MSKTFRKSSLNLFERPDPFKNLIFSWPLAFGDQTEKQIFILFSLRIGSREKVNIETESAHNLNFQSLKTFFLNSWIWEM